MINIDYDTLHYLTCELVDKIDPSVRDTIDYVAAPARGGLIPGVIISHMLQKPLIPLVWSNRNHDMQHHNEFLAEKLYTGSIVLLLDDINDSGRTFIEITSDLMYDDPHPNIPSGTLITAAVFQRHNTKFPCNLYARLVEDDAWVNFPYEQLKVNSHDSDH